MNRWECISKIVATVICGLFAIITIIFFLNGVGA
jgi:succinate dehydrogenase / fumarate reductase cytochrome b subunit